MPTITTRELRVREGFFCIYTFSTRLVNGCATISGEKEEGKSNFVNIYSHLSDVGRASVVTPRTAFFAFCSHAEIKIYMQITCERNIRERTQQGVMRKD